MLRHAAPHVLGALVRRSGDFETCEDAVQEAMLAAHSSWPTRGIPQDPTAWLITVAHRRLIDQLRSDLARVRRETQDMELSLRELEMADPGVSANRDDALNLLFLCCHPALTPISQVALTLRAVAGLTTAQIARAFLVSEANMTQRITRAKHKIRQSGRPFRMPPTAERHDRLRAVQHVLYLVFNEGYLTSSGPRLQRAELVTEGIRLARLLAALVPDDGESAGLLALMLLLDSRRAARTRADGTLIALTEQDRKLWDRAFVDEGIALITDSLARLPLGPYQVQAAIAALLRRPLRRPRPTGHRSSRSTRYSRRSPPTRWPRSGRRWLTQCFRARMPASPNLPCWTTTIGSLSTIGYTRFARTFSSCSATTRSPAAAISQPRNSPTARLKGPTSGIAQRESRRESEVACDARTRAIARTMSKDRGLCRIGEAIQLATVRPPHPRSNTS